MLPSSLDLDKAREYVCSYRPDEVIFREGESSQDLFWLLEGELEIQKGDQVIAYVKEPGAIFGEMSFLLGAPRSATVRARGPVKTLCLPKDGMSAFLGEHPEVLQEISQILAQRLARTSEVLHGLKEYCDQLPDAVLLTDKDGRVVSCNHAAEDLYGSRTGKIQGQPAADLFEDGERFRALMEQCRRSAPVSEEVLSIMHPSAGRRFISLSMKALTDSLHDYHGVVALGRDVTQAIALKRRFRRMWLWIMPLMLVLAGGAAGYTYYWQHTFGQEQMVLDERQAGFKTQLGKDYLYLRSLVKDHLEQKPAASPKLHSVLSDFLGMQKDPRAPTYGVILLNDAKLVVDAMSTNPSIDDKKMIGSTYAHIDFRGDQNSLHKVLEVYRAGRGGSFKAVEVAFLVRDHGRDKGWVVFQLDPDKLQKRYGLTAADLEAFSFGEP